MLWKATTSSNFLMVFYYTAVELETDDQILNFDFCQFKSVPNYVAKTSSNDVPMRWIASYKKRFDLAYVVRLQCTRSRVRSKFFHFL